MTIRIELATHSRWSAVVSAFGRGGSNPRLSDRTLIVIRQQTYRGCRVVDFTTKSILVGRLVVIPQPLAPAGVPVQATTTEPGGSKHNSRAVSVALGREAPLGRDRIE